MHSFCAPYTHDLHCSGRPVRHLFFPGPCPPFAHGSPLLLCWGAGCWRTGPGVWVLTDGPALFCCCVLHVTIFPCTPRLGPLRPRFMHGCPVLLLLLDAIGCTAVRGLVFGLVAVLCGPLWRFVVRRRAVKYKSSSGMCDWHGAPSRAADSQTAQQLNSQTPSIPQSQQPGWLHSLQQANYLARMKGSDRQPP